MNKSALQFGDGSVRLEISHEMESVAVVSLTRPERRNALDAAMIDALVAVASDLRGRDDVKAIILTGQEGIFSAGGDLSMFRTLQEAPSITAARRLGEKGARMCADWSMLPQPTIAAIEGAAIGGGLSIAVCCDWRVMAEDAWVNVPEVRLGLNFGWQTLPRLTALVGPARAKTISLLGRRHTAEECCAWGLADATAAKGGALRNALDIAAEVCAAPGLGPRLVKRAITQHSEALMSATSYGDLEELLLALRDSEGAAAREAFITAMKEKNNDT